MTVRELIVALLDTPLDAEVDADFGDAVEPVTGIARVERPGGSPHAQAYVTLEIAP